MTWTDEPPRMPVGAGPSDFARNSFEQVESSLPALITGTMNSERGMRACLGAILLMAATAAQLELELELASFGRLNGADQPAASSTLLAAPEDSPIQSDQAGEVTAALLFGHLPATAVRDLCSSRQGSEPCQEAMTYRSAANARAKPGSLRVRSLPARVARSAAVAAAHKSPSGARLQVSYISNCPNETDDSAPPQLAATTASGLQLIVSAAVGFNT